LTSANTVRPVGCWPLQINQPRFDSLPPALQRGPLASPARLSGQSRPGTLHPRIPEAVAALAWWWWCPRVVWTAARCIL